ncbi:hypothetical protein SAMN05660772_02041 [Pasteurella testudinis DSM 23072]|uniref:HTH cro/C1-type domain-containing protein n=1 Tax=Pasteurella testudinis DSM 23072 TaxID=1122938 RepID=A0A1W1UMI5_9PAST|nr:helix-turn-helix transcriptional regulator [Pasteurella testudinis]SMB82302.1 hypothetical protein SAMN05660772_02041 [Pasteurella testudinis DSM 23072]SUB51479.1 transcriptional regulator, y4mF family [Pasteurella testudinis]
MDIQDAAVMVGIGIRLKIERKRLQLRQIDVARLAGVSARTQCKYEFGQQEIRAKYLVKLAGLGFDVHYLITGIPHQVLMQKKEHQLLAKYRESTEELRQFLDAGLGLGDEA